MSAYTKCPHCNGKNQHRASSVGTVTRCKHCKSEYVLQSKPKSVGCIGCLTTIGIVFAIFVVFVAIFSNRDANGPSKPIVSNSASPLATDEKPPSTSTQGDLSQPAAHPKEQTESAKPPQDIKLKKEDPSIPGIFAVDLTGNLETRGFVITKRLGGEQSEWTAKSNAAGFEFTAQAFGSSPTKVTAVDATAMGPPKMNKNCVEFLSFVGSLTYDGSDPKAAQKWITDNFSTRANKPTTVIGPCKFELFGPTDFVAILRISKSSLSDSISLSNSKSSVQIPNVEKLDESRDTDPVILDTKVPDTSPELVKEAVLTTWTDTTGKFSTKATFVRKSDTEVVLRKEDGKEITIPIGKLSLESQEMVKQLK